MNKRLIAILLALCMALALLPAAWAEEPLAPGIAAPAWSATTLDGETINQDSYLGKTQVLVFFRGNGNCPNSNYTIQALAGSRWIAKNDIQVIAIEADQADRATVEAFRDRWAPDCDEIIFTYSSRDSYWSFWREAGLVSDNSILFAITAVVDAEGTLTSAWSGGYDEQLYADALGWGDAEPGPSPEVTPEITPEPSPEPPAAGGMQSSGGLSKLSKSEITQLLKQNPLDMPATVFESEPSLTAPYAPGKVRSAALQTAVNRLNALRRIAGVPSVAMDAALNESAQYGAVLLAVSEFSHYPPKPADMDAAFYQKAQSATSSSNIHYGTGPYANLPYSVDSFMDDSDQSNISRLGHRRWQLNPSMGKVGFGYVLDGRAGYIDEYVFDRSGSGIDYDFISWPASGYFPTGNFFGKNTAWSVTLNPSKYRAPDSGVTVKLSRSGDGQTWSFSGNGGSGYFNIENGGYGVNNCIIFRPDGIGGYSGSYTVAIEGLRTASGQDASLSYQVEFFDPGEGASAEPSAPTEPSKTVTYTVSVGASPSAGGTVTGGGSYEKGKSATVRASANTGYRFVEWRESGGRVSSSAGYTFTVSANRTLTAVFEKTADAPTAGDQSVTIRNSGAAGTVTSNLSGARAGSTVILSARADAGYISDAPTVRDGNGNSVPVVRRADGRYSFTMPEGGVTVTGNFVTPAQMFSDLSDSAWYRNELAYAVDHGLMQGVGDGRFDTASNTTRAMIVTILYRLEGEPDVSRSAFSDVAPGQYYTDAVAWAAENKIVEGYGNNAFGPQNVVTREQMATFLYRYAMYKGYDVSAQADLSGYADAGAVSGWALTAMRWANKKGLITGRTTTTLVSDGTAVRAEAAAILARFCQDVAGLD